MKKNTYRLYLVFVLLLTPYIYTPIFGQVIEIQVLDSLRGMSYEKLKTSFLENTQNKAIAELYADAYLWKAKKDRDTMQIAEGYHLKSNCLNDNKKRIIYFDSIISISVNNKGTRYPSIAFLLKGVLLDDLGDVTNAFDNYILALKYSQNQKGLSHVIKHNIGLLKTKIGANEEALEIFKECYQYDISQNNKEDNPEGYFSTLFALADSYQRNQKNDSASLIIKVGYKESSRINNLDWSNYFILMEGANQSKINNYQTSVDSILKSLPHLVKIGDFPNISEAYYYLGRSYYLSNNKPKGLYYLHKMDSIFWKNNYLLPEQREGYELIVKYYKEEKDVKNQLEYINRLLKFDSICNVKNSVLSKKIYSEYDTPILLGEKQEIIEHLNQAKTALSYRLKWFLSLLILTLFLMSFFFYRQRLYKSNFETISVKLKENQILINKKLAKKSSKDLSKEQVEIIMQRINNFERELGFLKKNINLQILSTRLKTNTTYLSKVFNQHKKQKLADYLNELRISYALEVLPKDKKLQQYTIKALASEFGYNTAESFSKAFFKRTEVYPSYYIKQLLEQSPTE